jgi:hypothetical protein
MRNPYELLYEKEKQLQRVRQEVEVLRTVIPLLLDETDYEVSTTAMGTSGTPNVIVFQGRNQMGVN